MIVWIAAAAAAPYTVDDAVKTALAHNPSLQRATTYVDSAEGRLLAARGIFDPQLGATLTYTPFSRRVQTYAGQTFTVDSQDLGFGLSLGGFTSSGGTYALTAYGDRRYGRYVLDTTAGPIRSTVDQRLGLVDARFTQPILRGHRYAYNMRGVILAEDGLTVADLAVKRDRQALIATTTGNYWAWAYAVDVVTITADAEKAADESVRVGRLRQGAGTIAPIELTRLEASVIRAQTDRVEAEHAAIRARHALELALGEPLPEGAVPGAPDASELVVPTTEQAVAIALTDNPSLLIARAEHAAADRQVDNAGHALLPTLDARLDAGLQGGYVDGGAQKVVPYTTVGATFALPLGNRASRGARDVAVADRHAAELTIAEVEAALRVQIDDAVLGVASAAKRVELADSNVTLTKALLDAEEARVAAGGAIEMDLLRARTDYARARVEAARARTDHRVAMVGLAQLQGTLEVP